MSSTKSIYPPGPATENWSQEALLLVGQGSERFGPPGQLLRAHADRLRARRLFQDVEAACLAGEPNLTTALRKITARTIHVVPFFMSNGYLVSTLLPKLLAQAATDESRHLHIHSAVGEHPDLADLLLRRAEARARDAGIDPMELTLLLVGHGTPRNPASAAATNRNATRVAASNSFAAVRVAFLDEVPHISNSLLQGLGPPAGVLSLFATVGLHGGEDIPNMITAARAARGWDERQLLDLGIIGDEPDMADLVLAQIRPIAS